MAARYRLKKASDGSFYWVTVAENGEPLSTSEMYTTADSARQGAAANGYQGDRLEVEDDG